MNRKQRRLAVLAGGLGTLLFLQATPVVAQEGDSRNPFSFWVSQSFYHDSNLRRMADDEYFTSRGLEAPKKRSDTYFVTRAGVNFDTEVSRQAFQAGLSLGRTQFRSNSNFSNTSWDGRLNWDWRIGDRWSGVLGYSHSETPVPFDDVIVRREDGKVMKQRARLNASADYWWHPDWATGFGFSDVRSSYDSNRYNHDKYDAQSASLNFTYRPSTGNRIILGYIYEEGQYPNKLKKEELGPGQTSMRDWERTDYRLSGQWRLTGVTQLNGYVGYTKRKYDLAPNRDFSGLTGSIGFRWVPTGKAIVELSWRREIGADRDTYSNFAVSQGWLLRPTWVVTSKVRLGASYEYLERDYRGDPGYLPGGLNNPRDGKTHTYGVNFQYMPVSNASITLGYENRRRDAKDKYYEYSARTVWLSGSMTF